MIRSLLALLVSCTLVGCGGGADLPPIGQVSGVVTLDGEPLEGALVEFIPRSGRSSSALTDAQGRYVLRYTATVLGAMVGEHTVSITSAREAISAEGSQPAVEARPEILPPRYHVETTLLETVIAGPNEINFALTSAEDDLAPPEGDGDE